MPKGRPVDDETRTRIAELCADGLTRNAIARAVHLSGSTVSSIAEQQGHTFDRTEIRAAIEARQIDLAGERVKLAEAATVAAWQALDDMNAPTVLVQWDSGHAATLAQEYVRGEFREHVLDRPSIPDLRNLATIFGIMSSKVAELTRPLVGSMPEGTLSVLEQVGDSIADAARKLAADGVDPTAEPDVDEQAPGDDRDA